MKVAPSRLITAAIGLLALSACGGGDADAPAATPAAAANGAAPEVAAQDTTPRPRPQLVREEFSYRGGNRDPFLSLVRPGGEDRPRVEDLKLSTILYDAVYPVRSVAVVRDTVDNNRRYELRVGDELGRFRVADIRPRELVVAIDEFGAERMVVLSVRSLQEEVQ